MKSLRKLIREYAENIVFEQDVEDPAKKMEDDISKEQEKLSDIEKQKKETTMTKNGIPQNLSSPEWKKVSNTNKIYQTSKEQAYSSEIKKSKEDIKAKQDQLKTLQDKGATADVEGKNIENVDADYQKQLDNILNAPKI